MSRRTRLTGLAGDLEFLRHVDSLPDQERRRLRATEDRLERRFAGLGNSARRSSWLELGTVELAEPRDRLMIRLGRYADELNAMPSAQRAATWDHELGDAARRHLRMLCPWATR
jgi:hypothetical protein